MLCSKQVQLCQLRPILRNEPVQHRGMTSHHKCVAMVTIGRNIDALAPLYICRVITAIVGMLLQGVGQHEGCSLITVMVDDTLGTILLQVHPIEVLADGKLDSSGTGAVGAEVGPPLLQLATLPRLLRRVGVHLTGHR